MIIADEGVKAAAIKGNPINLFFFIVFSFEVI
jgi:hypothetical protein